MGRSRRVFIPGLSLHVIHRGHNRMSLFLKDEDFDLFLSLLRRTAIRRNVAIHAYALMTNHVHMIATPPAEDTLSQAIKELAGGYTRYFNSEYQRMGTVWNSRYRGLLIEDEAYWLTCLRYVEQNPVRAGMVESPDAYRWSTYTAHAHGQWEDWLSPHPLYQSLGRTARERQAAYRAICAAPVPCHEAELVRCQTRVRHQE